jgi:D-3-phosphoglycerate dehydrogenase
MLNLCVIGDDFTPRELFEEHLRAKLSDSDLNIIGFNMGSGSPTIPGLIGVKEYFGDPEQVREMAADADVLIATFAPITRGVLASATHLKLIACARSWPTNVDIPYATQKRIPVVCIPGRNADAVADYTIGLMICLCRNIVRANNYVHSGEWKSPLQDTFEKPTGVELHNRTLGIVGFGQVGSRVRERAKSFGLRVLIHDPFVRTEGAEFVNLDDLLRNSDIITVHARVKDGSPPLIGSREFNLMKKRALLINTSRAAAVDEDALYDALLTKRIGGAALDVYKEEPIRPNHRLLALENVILTPHVAGMSLDIPVRTCEMIADEVALFVSGKRLNHIANPEVLSNKHESNQER